MMMHRVASGFSGMLALALALLAVAGITRSRAARERTDRPQRGREKRPAVAAAMTPAIVKGNDRATPIQELGELTMFLLDQK